MVIEPLKVSDELLDDEGEGLEVVEEESPPADEVHRLRVRKRIVGRRLDKFLHSRYPRISRTLLQSYIKQGQVTVNGLPTKASYEPSSGDEVQIILPPPPPSEVLPQDIPLDIVYEDEWLIAINKAEGMVCHPAYASQTGTVANAVAFHAATLSRGEDPFRPGIVHRLDKNTTGVLLIAKTDEAHWRVSLQFERRTVRKEYFAICEGRVKLDGDIINKPLAPHPETTQRMVLSNTAGRP
ncbi:MAG: RluA family pseudouridine synthase, partial [Planctomycetota bacterium]